MRVNIASLDESTGDVGARLASEARACIDAASVHARLAEAAAERAMSGA